MKDFIEKEGNFYCKGCGKMKDYSDDLCDCDNQADVVESRIIERLQENPIEFDCGCNATANEKGAYYLDVICSEHDCTAGGEEDG